jgi:repressor LexA
MAATKMQMRIFDFINKYIFENGYPPSVREIGAAVGLRSPSTVHAHLNTLEKLGMITRSSGKTRSITVNVGVSKGVPILGSVAAGIPSLAVEDILGYLPFNTGQNENYFALRICGESMKNAGILDGDMVIVKKQPSAYSGQIVVALLDDETTCKRYRLKGKNVWLCPENENFSPMRGESARILGIVTNVVRNYY